MADKSTDSLDFESDKANYERVSITVMTVSLAALLLFIPETQILNSSGWDCELRNTGDYELGKESALSCSGGSLHEYDFFKLAACADPQHGINTNARFEFADTTLAAAASGVHKIEPLKEYYNIYDHCTAPAYIFAPSRRTYDATDFDIVEHSGYLGRQNRPVGGARLAMSIRMWIPMTGLIMAGAYVGLYFSVRMVQEAGDALKLLRDVVGFGTTLFCGLYIVCALSTFMHMENHVVPDYIVDNLNLGHMFEAGWEDPDSKGGTGASWIHEAKFIGTQNKGCGQPTKQALTDELNKYKDAFCCNNSMAQFVNPVAGDFLSDTSNVHGQALMLSITVSLILFITPVITNAKHNFTAAPLMDFLGSLCLLGSAICILIMAFTGIKEGRCGDAGDQLASMGLTSGNGDVSSSYMGLFQAAGIFLSVVSVGNLARAVLKIRAGQDTVEGFQMYAMFEQWVNGHIGMGFVAVTALLVSVALGQIIGTNATDMCEPIYADHHDLERILDVAFVLYLIYVCMYVGSGFDMLKRLEGVPGIGFAASQLAAVFSLIKEAIDKPGKVLEGKSGMSNMGYAMSGPMNSNTIKLTTFN